MTGNTFSILSKSSWQLGTSFISPITCPAVQTPASLSPSINTLRPRTPETNGCIFLKSGASDVFSISMTFSAIEFCASARRLKKPCLENSCRIPKRPHDQRSVSFCPLYDLLLNRVMDRCFLSCHEPSPHIDASSDESMLSQNIGDTPVLLEREQRLSLCHLRSLHWQCREVQVFLQLRQEESNQSHRLPRGVQHIQTHRSKENLFPISELK